MSRARVRAAARATGRPSSSAGRARPAGTSRFVASIPGANPTTDCGERLRAARRPELPGYEGTDHDRSCACEDRERAKTDQRPAEQLSGQRREQRRHGWKLDVPALKMQPGNGVIQLIAVPAVSPGDGKLQRALQRDDDENRPDRKRYDRFRCGTCRHGTKPRTQRHPRVIGSRNRVLRYRREHRRLSRVA